MVIRAEDCGSKESNDAEHAIVAIETSVYHVNKTEGIKSEEVGKHLHGDDGIGDGIVLRDRLLKKNLLSLFSYIGLNEMSINLLPLFFI